MRELPPELLTKLRSRRGALHLSRDELAEQVGCSERFVTYMENGERVPGPPLAARIAQVLEFDHDTLARWDACTGWRAT